MNEVATELETKLDHHEKMDYLSGAYPSLYYFILEHFKMTARIEEYMAQCKTFENDAVKFSLYIHGYLHPWFDRQR